MAEDYQLHRAGRLRLGSRPNEPPKHTVEIGQHSSLMNAPWKQVQGSRRARGPPSKRLLPVRLIDTDDNDGEKAASQNEAPKTHVNIPIELLQEARDVSSRFARDHGTFLLANPGRDSSNHCNFDIYGQETNALRTKQCIEDWLAANKPSKIQSGTSRFAKQGSMTLTLRYLREREWEFQVQRFKYRKHPMPGTEFGAIGSFLWPSKDCSIPLDPLGPNFEALDKIRMDESCFIVWDGKGSLFKVFGGAKSVCNSLERLRMVCFQIVARQMPGYRTYLLNIPDALNIPTHIRLVPHETLAILTPTNAKQSTPGLTPIAEGSALDIGERGRATTSYSIRSELIESSLLAVFGKLHYFRGYLQLRIRLGTFIATRFKSTEDSCYTIGEFRDMISQSQFTGYVTPHIGNRTAESRLLSIIKDADHLLLPEGHQINKLEDVQPTYAAHFTFQDRSGYFRLMVEWHKATELDRQTDTMERISMKWIKFDQDDTALLDLSLIDVQEGRAWQFDLVGAQSIEEAKLPGELASFSRRLKIVPNVAHCCNTSALFVQFPHSPLLQSLQQRIIYRYDLRPIGTEYTLEVARLQDHIPQAPQRATFLGESTDTGRIYEARWAINVYRNEWDRIFSGNESLPVGARAHWEDEAATWFPNEGPTDGFLFLMDKLRAVQNLTKVVTEDLITGMSLG